MNGGKECEGGVVEGQTAPVQVPMGWQRRVDPRGVHYISPSGSVLSSLDQVKTYLLTDGTCKCGLECPLTLPKVFNFDPGAAVKQRTADDVRADEDVTKLCIHKRKLLAVATLHKSVKAMAPARFTAQRAIRNKPYETAPPNSVVPDCKNPFRMMMQHHHHQQQQQQQRHHYPPELGGAQMQQELYPGYPRQQQQRMSNSSEPGPRSPYRGGYGAMLSPTPSSGSSHHFLYGDGGSLSPRTDLMGSPLGHHNPPSSSSFSFPGGAAATSPGGRTPLSPPGMLRLHSSSPGATAQLSCAVMAAAGRTSTPLSPTATAKSPVMTNKARGGAGFAPPPMNAAAFHHKTPPHPHPAPSPGAPPPCALQRKQTSSEKDPLGILDPILSKPPPSSSSNPPGYQPSGVLLSQVPAMNVTIPPAIVPLPSNLPLPTVKPGGHVHVQRTQQAAALSPSPVTSPGHAGAGPGPPLGGGGRTEASPHRSRSSSTSSDHGGSFAVPQAAAGGGGVGGVKAPPHPRSPRSVVGSPRPAMPSSPSSSSSNARPSDALHLHHQYKDAPGQLLSGMSGGGAQHNPMYPPPPTTGGTGAGGPPQAMQGHPGLLGMPLNQILSKQNAASFPASSLLSAAAKAQLANQNKQSANNNNNNGGGMSVGGGTGSGHPGPLGGARSVEAGHGTLNPMLPPNSAALLAAPEGGGAVQSGRAALRDKLMAQQRERDPLRKRKQPGNSGAASANHDSVILNMLGGKPGMMGNGGPSSRSPLAAAEQLRKAGRLGGGLPPNASMAQLLQSMSGQNSHMSAGNHRLQNSHPAGPGPMHYPGDGPMAHQGAAQQRLLHGQAGEGLHCQRTDPGPHGQFPGMMMTQMQAGPLAGCGPLSSGGPPDGLPLGHHSHNNTNPPPPPLSHPGQPQHPHSQNHVGTLGRSGLSRMALNGNEESGDPSSLSCGVSNPQLGVLQAHHHNHHHLHPHHHHHHGGSNGGQMYPQHSQGQQQQQQHLHHHPGFQGAQAYPDLPLQDNGSSGSMACLYQNYQQSCLPENVPLTQMSSQAGMTSLPETQGGMLSHPQFGEGMLGTDRLPGGGGGGGTESVDAIYRAVVDAASKGMHVVITATVSGVTQSGPAPSLSAMSAFGGGSVAGEGGPVGLPHHAAVQHARLPRQARPGRPQKTPEHGTGGAADAPEAHDYFRSPQGAGQWDGSGVGGEVHGGLDGHGGGPWGGGGGSGEEFLECSTQVRSGPCAAAPAPPPSCPPEAPHDHGLLPAAASDKGGFLEDAFRFGNNCVRMPLNYKERLEQTVERCAQMNGGFQFSTVGRGGGYGVDVLGPPRHELTGDDQSPGSSTSLEGPLPPVAREYAHYGNGHFNGHCAPSPSDTKSLSSEEELRHPDSPSSSSSELLHYRPARGSFHVGELVWGGQLKGFPPWPAKLAGEEQQLHHHHHHHHHHHGAGGPLRDQGKVEAEKRKTLTHDLEALDRATKRSRKSGKLNNHLEAAIHEAMSELDKMSGTVHQLPSRDRQAKVPKPKRRKISR